jgi:membrane protease YdiL (CAAX protease family)
VIRLRLVFEFLSLGWIPSPGPSVEVTESPASKMTPHKWEAVVPSGPQKRERVLELAVFLFLIVPSMSLSFLVVRQGNLTFVIAAIATILRDLSLVVLIAFFLWRNGEGRDRINWRFRSSRDVFLGIVLFVFMFLAAGYLDQLLQAAGFSKPATPLPKFLTAHGSAEYLLAVVLVAVVAFAEEIIFRGYMILRLTEVTGNSVAAILVSSVIFALGHGYEGTAGVITVAFMGLAFAIVYVRTGSLAAPMIMHFLQDFIGIVAVPLLKHRG